MWAILQNKLPQAVPKMFYINKLEAAAEDKKDQKHLGQLSEKDFKVCSMWGYK